jgi:tetratricopeptide (TPR) repeat protein
VFDGKETETGLAGVDRPRLSPDGKTVAFKGWEQNRSYVVVGEKKYGPYSWVSHPVWRADGKRVAFVADRHDLYSWRVVDPFHEDAEGHLNASEARYKEKDYAGAIKEADLGLDLSHDADFYVGEALSRAALGDSQEAMAYAIDATTAEPERFDGWSVRGQLAVHDDPTHAKAVFDDALKNLPGAAELWFDRGSFELTTMNDPAAAMADLGEALKLDARYDTAWMSRSAARYALGDYRGAVSDADKAIELDPQNGTGWFNRGASRLKLGETESACQDLSKAAENGAKAALDLIRAQCTPKPPPPSTTPAPQNAPRK